MCCVPISGLIDDEGNNLTKEVSPSLKIIPARRWDGEKKNLENVRVIRHITPTFQFDVVRPQKKIQSALDV